MDHLAALQTPLFCLWLLCQKFMVEIFTVGPYLKLMEGIKELWMEVGVELDIPLDALRSVAIRICLKLFEVGLLMGVK